MTRTRVVITGIGLRVPGAASMSDLRALYVGGRAATGPLPGALSTWSGGVVRDNEADNADPERSDRATVLAGIAAREAVTQSGLAKADLAAAGVFCGTGGAGMVTLEAAIGDLSNHGSMRSNTLPRSMVNAPASHISIAHGCTGPVMTYAMACSSSAHALGEAVLAVRTGRCPAAIAGGVESAMTHGVLRSWAALRLLAQGEGAACRPFCYERGGLLLGEGAVFFTLETLDGARARGVEPLAEIAGYGARSDASHITAPSPDGQSATVAAALADAGMVAIEVGHVSAHGTATLAGDLSETRALRAVFGDHAPRLAVTANKSFHGHLLGAAGALNVLTSLLAVREGLIAPTIHFGSEDPELGLDYVPNIARRETPVAISLCNAFGFGGSNASLLIRRI